MAIKGTWTFSCPGMGWECRPCHALLQSLRVLCGKILFLASWLSKQDSEIRLPTGNPGELQDLRQRTLLHASAPHLLNGRNKQCQTPLVAGRIKGRDVYLSL